MVESVRRFVKSEHIACLHLVVLVLGTALMFSGCFHSAVWFDESYTVGMMNQSFGDMLRISVADVHPPFYYIALWLFTRVFGCSAVAMRLFSALCASTLGVLGYTHIRKDFGARTGLYFSLFLFLFGALFISASDIRMYTLAPLLVALMFIYCCRYWRSGFTDTHARVLYILFALLAAYTHWYALAAAVVTALFLIYPYWKSGRLLRWFVDAAFLLGLYIPGFFIFYTQATRVAGGFWISFSYPDILFDTLRFFALGVEPASDSLRMLALIVVGFIFAFCLLFHIVSRKNDVDGWRPSGYALGIVVCVIALYLIVSELFSPVYHVRYLGVLIAPVAFFLAFAVGRMRFPALRAVFPLLLCVLLVLRVIPLYQDRYAPDRDVMQTFASAILPGDVVISENINIFGPLMVTAVEGEFYFYNPGWWPVDEAYQAFAPKLRDCVNDLAEIGTLAGRVWIVGENGRYSIYDGLQSAFGGLREIARGEVVQPYHDIEFDWTLYEVDPT